MCVHECVCVCVCVFVEGYVEEWVQTEPQVCVTRRTLSTHSPVVSPAYSSRQSTFCVREYLKCEVFDCSDSDVRDNIYIYIYIYIYLI